MRYQCNPYYKYISHLIVIYLILKYIMRINLTDDTIKGIALVSVILSFALDTITIENHHMLFFEKQDEVIQSLPYSVDDIPIEQIPIEVLPIQQSEEIFEDDNDEEKSFMVDDIRSIQSEHFDNISRTENIYHEVNNKYTDNGIPIEKYTELADSSNKEEIRQPQPYPKTTVKKQAIRSIRF